jgi:quercetin dioxygenase-like cupin family protein
MRKTICLLRFVFALVLAPSAYTQTVVPLTGEPSHHLAISNEFVRVFKVEVAPHADTLYHQHDHDYVYVTVGDADVNNVVLHGQQVRMALKDGQVRFSKAPLAHKAQNNGEQPFRNVTVEFLKGIGTPVCGLPGAQQSCGIGPGWSGGADGNSEMSSGYSQPVFRASRMTVDEFTTKGGSDIPSEALPQAPFLLIAVSSMKLRLASQKGTQDLAAQPGDVFWYEEPVSSFETLPSATKFVVISFATQKTQ